MKTIKADAISIISMKKENCIRHLIVVVIAKPEQAEMVTIKSLIVTYDLTLLSMLVSSSPIVPRYFQRNLFCETT